MRVHPLVEIHREVSVNEMQKKAKREGVCFAGGPLLACLFSVTATVSRAVHKERGIVQEPPIGLSCLGSCVRKGFDSVEKLALRHYTKVRALNRRAIHREYAPLASNGGPCEESDDISDVLQRIDQASLS